MFTYTPHSWTSFQGFLVEFSSTKRKKTFFGGNWNENPDLWSILFQWWHGLVNYRMQVLVAFLNCEIRPYQMVHFQFEVFLLPIDKECYWMSKYADNSVPEFTDSYTRKYIICLSSFLVSMTIKWSIFKFGIGQTDQFKITIEFVKIFIDFRRIWCR